MCVFLEINFVVQLLVTSLLLSMFLTVKVLHLFSLLFISLATRVLVISPRPCSTILSVLSPSTTLPHPYLYGLGLTIVWIPSLTTRRPLAIVLSDGLEYWAIPSFLVLSSFFLIDERACVMKRARKRPFLSHGLLTTAFGLSLFRAFHAIIVWAISSFLFDVFADPNGYRKIDKEIFNASREYHCRETIQVDFITIILNTSFSRTLSE